MKRLSFLLAPVLWMSLTSRAQNYSQWVNPFIGTGGHGHTFPGAVMPFGMVQLSPDTRIDGSWDGCSGYHHSDSVIYGFSHTHLSGTGCSDWGDVLVMPVNGEPHKGKGKAYVSVFSHSTEKAEPGYYEVFLNKPKVRAELTVTPRVGIHRYHFAPKAMQAIAIDLTHRDKLTDYSLRVEDSVTVTGYRVSDAWAKGQTVYFMMKFSKPIKYARDINGNNFSKQNLPDDSKGQNSITYYFGPSDGKPLLVKVGISHASAEGAAVNLEAETPHWDFENYKQHAREAWNKQLSKVAVYSNSPDKLKVFYTALYHCFIHPTLATDLNGDYRGADGKVRKANGYTHYTAFSLWDTYRGLHPLFTLLERQRTSDFMNTFLNMYRQSGRLPVWELSGYETDCMIGFHSVSVIADAMVKGIRGVDSLALYDAMKAASNYTRFSIPAFNKNGYLQVDDESESVSKSLEYGYDNWCIAQVAGIVNKPEERDTYLKRSLSYKNLFDAKTGHMRPRRNGGWLSPFVPNEINNHFTEGNSWQYSFYVPHDVAGLINISGGERRFESKLDALFTSDSKTLGREQADVTGLIGQYAHGNEPSHHMAYLYNYCGKPDKAVQRIRQIRDNFYTNAPDGLIGNEDCGQMSAWYVLSAMGFYPVCPGSTQYATGEPAFDSLAIQLENGKTVRIKANPGTNKPVTGIRVNGVTQVNAFLEHSELMQGGNFEFVYEPRISGYGVEDYNRPFSAVKEVGIVPAPIISASRQVFKDTLHLSIEAINSPIALLAAYSASGKDPDALSPVYLKPLVLDSSCRFNARLFANGAISGVSSARFYKLRNDYGVVLQCTLNPQYAAEGGQTLLDGMMGDVNWRKGNWLGVQGQDFLCVVDLKKQKEITSIGLDCLQDTPSWIVFPKSVSYYGSNDGKVFTLIQTVANPMDVKDEVSRTRFFEAKLSAKANYRYVKVVAKNYGKLPAWHPGAGGQAFVFADELEVR